MGFAASSYTTSEADAVVEVCVSVLSGQLGTNITLQLDTHSRTAEGMYVHVFIHKYSRQRFCVQFFMYVT